MCFVVVVCELFGGGDEVDQFDCCIVQVCVNGVYVDDLVDCVCQVFVVGKFDGDDGVVVLFVKVLVVDLGNVVVVYGLD